MHVSPKFGLASSISRAAQAVAVASVMGVGALTAAGESLALEQLQKYCTTSWHRAGIARQEWDDCTQAALARLLSRVSRGGLATSINHRESPERRELNRAIWAVVQRVKRDRRLSFCDVSRTADRERSDRDSWQELMAEFGRTLTPRQRDLLALAADGWSIAEIGERLGMSPARASDEKYKAIQKLRRELAASEVQSPVIA